MTLIDPLLAGTIYELKSTYFASIDNKRWDRVKSLFTEDAQFSGYAFDAAGAIGFTMAVAKFLDGVTTQHAGYNPRLAMRRNGSVRAVWAMHDYLTWPVGTRNYRGFGSAKMYGIRGWGYYEDTYVNTGSGVWKIKYSRLVRSRVDALIGDPPPMVDMAVAAVYDDWLSE